MFVFSSILIVATWYLSRLLWDFALRPSWRGSRERAAVRFAAITGSGCLLAAVSFGAVVGAIYGALPGLVAGAALVPAYLFIAFVLRMLLQSFDVDVDGGSGRRR